MNIIGRTTNKRVSDYKLLLLNTKPGALKKVFKEVLSKRGGKGIDGKSSEMFRNEQRENYRIIKRKCANGTYNFSPYLEVLKSKGRNKYPRVISMPTLRDKLVLFAVKEVLHSIYNECIEKKLPNTYIKEINEHLKGEDTNSLAFFKYDIKEFYGSIDHEILLNTLSRRIRSKILLRIIKKAIKNPTRAQGYKRRHVDKDKWHNQKGVPQGLAISNILANIYLSELDMKYRRIKSKCRYYRYVDDILVIARSNSIENIKSSIRGIISKYKLELNDDKKEEGIIKDGFEYLGYRFEHPVVTVRRSSVERYIQSIAGMFSGFRNSMRYKIKRNHWLNEKAIKEIFVLDLNEKITGAISEKRRYGWLFYYIQINDVKLLFKIDAIINKLFKATREYNYKKPIIVKRIVKAYYEAKYKRNTSYIHDYNIYDSYLKKMKYLIKYGYMNPKKRYTKKEIEDMFDWVRNKRLSRLDLDVGIIS